VSHRHESGGHDRYSWRRAGLPPDDRPPTGKARAHPVQIQASKLVVDMSWRDHGRDRCVVAGSWSLCRRSLNIIGAAIRAVPRLLNGTNPETLRNSKLEQVIKCSLATGRP